MEKQKRGSFYQMAAVVCSVVFALLMLPQQIMAGTTAITERIGNETMKEYGERLLNGEEAVVQDGVAPEGSGTTYFVDSVAGDDFNDGTSESTPWKSIEKVNSMTYQAGDRILLKAGSEWSDVTLQPKDSGEEGKPLIISCYGSGAMPKLTGNGSVAELIYLENQSYVDISYINISNMVEGFTGIYNKNGSEDGKKVGDFRGIRVAGNPETEALTLKGIRIHHVYIHDVSGECRWVGGNADSADASTGTYKGGGWDLSKRTGGILFEVLQPDTGDKPVVFEDIMVEDNVLNNNSFGGIIFKQWYGEKTGTNENWANRERGNNFTPHKNITVQNNYLNHKKNGFACDTIYLTSIAGAVIQNNVSVGAGTCGIELCYTDDVTIQYNEIIDTMTKAGGADSAGIDPDRCATNALIQYNYVHGTGDGILLCGFTMGSAVVRYNVIQDAEKRYINIHGDKGANYIYQNTFLNTEDREEVTFINTSGGTKYRTDTDNLHYFFNNIFYNASDAVDEVVIGEGTSWFYDSNSYYGTAVTIPSAEINAITGNPELTDESQSGLAAMKTDITRLENICLRYTSPLIGKGREIVRVDDRADGRYLMWSLDDDADSDMEQKDFFGNALAAEKGIGAADYQISQDMGLLHGYVKDTYGYLVEGATVSAAGKTAVTDENGFFAFEMLSAADYTLSVTAENYNAGEEKQVSVTGGSIISVEMELGASTITVGTIAGMVRNVGGGALAYATVTVTNGTETYTGTTDSDGNYSIENLPVKGGYQVTAEKADYQSDTVTGQSVRPAYRTTVDFTLKREQRTKAYTLDENFEGYEVGTFTGNDIWGVIAPSGKGSVEIKQEAETGKKYLSIDKTASSNFSVYNKAAFNLTGTVTIEMRIMRTSQGSSNQFGAYTYNSTDWNGDDPNTSANPMATIALSKGSYITHNVTGASSTVTGGAYQLNTWDIIRNVANLEKGTFDFYINDMQNPVLANQPLRSIYETLDYINIFSSSKHTGDLCVDYIRVCEGLPADYNDATLSDLSVDGVAAVQKGQTWELSETLSFETEEVAVLPKRLNQFSKVTVNGELFDGENPVKVKLADTTNQIAIEVTAEDGETACAYTLTVKKEDINEIAYLKNLTAKGVQLSPDFARDVTEYTAKVASDVESIVFDVEKYAAQATVEVIVNDVTQQDNPTVVLKEGENQIAIKSGSVDGTNYITYQVTVTREKKATDTDDGDTEQHEHVWSKEWVTDDSIHWHVCSTCGEQNDRAEHAAGEWIIDVEATQTKPGSKHTECTVCQKVLETREIPKVQTEGGNENTGENSTEEGNGNTGENNAEDGNQEEKPETVLLKKGTVFTNTATNEKYRITEPGKIINGVVTGGKVSYYKSNTKKKSVVIGTTVTYQKNCYEITSIADKAFANHKKLTSVKIGSKVQKIGQSAFAGCSRLQNVSIGKNVTTIGQRAFYKCTKLKKVVLPAKVTVIQKQAFANCKNLKQIIIRSSKLKTVGKQAISGINKQAIIKVPKKKLKSYKNMFHTKTGWKKTMKIKKI